MAGYIDLYLLPVPTKHTAAYRRQARLFGKVMRECGALSYREFAADDLHPDGTVSFASAVTMKRSDVLTTAVAEFSSRRHRDQVMKKVMNHPSIQGMMKEKPLADMTQMIYGGFKTFVSA